MANANEVGSMTGQELLEHLQGLTPEDLALPVLFAHPSHDYWHTELAGEISQIEPGHISWSRQHDKFRTLDEDAMQKARDHAMGDEEDEPLSEEELDNLTYDNKPIIKVLIIHM